MYEMYCGIKKKKRMEKEAMPLKPLESPLLGQTTYLSTATRVVSRNTAKMATAIADFFILHFC